MGTVTKKSQNSCWWVEPSQSPDTEEVQHYQPKRSANLRWHNKKRKYTYLCHLELRPPLPTGTRGFIYRYGYVGPPAAPNTRR